MHCSATKTIRIVCSANNKEWIFTATQSNASVDKLISSLKNFDCTEEKDGSFYFASPISFAAAIYLLNEI